MCKFLYFQDGHVKGKNSANRIGNYFSDWLIKFDELLNIAKEHNVSAILDGGDLLDAPEPSYRIIDEIVDRVEKVEIPIYCLFGNHAERYHSLEHSKYTGLAHMIKRSKYLNYFCDGEGGLFYEKGKFEIIGYEYYHNIEEKLKNNGIIFPKSTEEMWKIAIVHAFVTPKPFLPQVMHVCCDDIKTNANIILIAHYHVDWERKIENTLFKDIGCFGRNSITEAKSKPSCLIIDTETRTIKEIELKSAKKGSDIFDLEKIKEIKAYDKNMLNFIKSLESTEFQSTDIKGIIEDIAKKNKVERNIVDLILDNMEAIEE